MTYINAVLNSLSQFLHASASVQIGMQINNTGSHMDRNNLMKRELELLVFALSLRVKLQKWDELKLDQMNAVYCWNRKDGIYILMVKNRVFFTSMIQILSLARFFFYRGMH